MANMLYQRAGRVEHTYHDQTYILVGKWERANLVVPMARFFYMYYI